MVMSFMSVLMVMTAVSVLVFFVVVMTMSVPVFFVVVVAAVSVLMFVVIVVTMTVLVFFVAVVTTMTVLVFFVAVMAAVTRKLAKFFFYRVGMFYGGKDFFPVEFGKRRSNHRCGGIAFSYEF